MSTKPVNVAVIGASGYTGLELLRLLGRRTDVNIAAATSRSYEGRAVAELLPEFRGRDIGFVNLPPSQAAADAEIAFLALPHGESMKAAGELRDAGKKVIDLSGDFRFRDAAIYEANYGKHSRPELLAEAVYGLPEINREVIAGASLIGCPGCYPTSVILALAPLLRAGLIEPGGMIVNSASGVSGAGRTPKTDLLFAEIHVDFKAYGLAGHRHQAEMDDQLSQAAGAEVSVLFQPHLLPIARGILSTCYLTPRAGTSLEQAQAALAEAYARETFVRLLPAGESPRLKDVAGTNYCDISLTERDGRFIALSGIDNLIKGAAGNAIACLNLVAGLPETAGLPTA